MVVFVANTTDSARAASGCPVASSTRAAADQMDQYVLAEARVMALLLTMHHMAGRQPPRDLPTDLAGLQVVSRLEAG
jgi:hypothetical protein